MFLVLLVYNGDLALSAPLSKDHLHCLCLYRVWTILPGSKASPGFFINYHIDFWYGALIHTFMFRMSAGS